MRGHNGYPGGNADRPGTAGTGGASRPALHLAASLGGHLDLLMRLRDCFEPYDCVWVTAAGTGADGIRAQGADVRDVTRFNRARPHTAVQNAIEALRLVIQERPRTLVVTGAGSVVAFATFARLFGARLIFIETTARIRSASASGRVLSRLAGSVLVQWPELKRVYPRAEVCRPLVYDDAGTAPSLRRGGGTVVAVGSHRHPFDRLLALVDRAVGDGLLPGPVVAQRGSSRYVPAHFSVEPWMAQEELEEAIGRSDYVICHAGTGLISTALRSGRKPLVLARRASRKEHVDDHQVEIVDKLAGAGLLVPLDGRLTETELTASRQAPAPPLPAGDPSLRARLTALLREALGDGNDAAADRPDPISRASGREAAAPRALEAPAARIA